MTPADVIRRARSAAGTRTRYQLGQGGTNPAAPHPATNGACDCSGFTSWALGVARQTTHPTYRAFNGGWINTDAMVHDARTGGGLFTRIPVPRVGCLAVYGKAPGRAYGHVGLVTGVENGTIAAVLHCSSGNWRNHGDAIRETDAAAFRTTDTIFAWFDGMDAPREAPAVPVRPVRLWAIVTASSLNARPAPNTQGGPIGARSQGARIIIDAITDRGEVVDGNGAWLRDVDGSWWWAGGTDLAHPGTP